MLSVKTKGYMRNQKKNLYLALMMVGGSREGFKKVVTFEMSLGNSELKLGRNFYGRISDSLMCW